MLKKSSAAKGQSNTSQEYTQVTPRVIRSTEQSKAFARRDDEFAKKSQPRGSQTCQQSAQGKPSSVLQMEEGVPPELRGGSPDAHRSPRQQRVSLQGVFSPKVGVETCVTLSRSNLFR